MLGGSGRAYRVFASITWCASPRPRSAARPSRWSSERAAIARAERGITWAFGADELYLRAGARAAAGARSTTASIRSRTAWGRCAGCSSGSRRESGSLHGWAGKRIGVVTGTAMAQLMPMVLEPLAADHRRRVRADSGGEHALRTQRHHRRPAPRRGHCSRRSGAAATWTWCCCRANRINDDGLFIDSMSVDLLGRIGTGGDPALPGLHRRAAASRWPHEQAHRRHRGPAQRGKVHPVQPNSRRAARPSSPNGRAPRATGTSATPSGRAGSFWVVDTGGLVPESDDSMDRAIRQQVEFALAESDVIAVPGRWQGGTESGRSGHRRAAPQGRSTGPARGQQAGQPGARAPSSTRSTRSASAIRSG